MLNEQQNPLNINRVFGIFNKLWITRSIEQPFELYINRFTFTLKTVEPNAVSCWELSL